MMNKYINNLSSIAFVRHGENEIIDGLDNDLLPLNSNGIRQVRWVKDIIDDDFDIIISSNSKRSIDTANIIGNNIIINPYLLEMGYGNATHDGNETLDEARNRLIRVLIDINNTYRDKRVIVVTHGKLIKLIQNLIENRVIPRDTVENAMIIKYKNNHKYMAKPFDKNIEKI